MAFAVNTRVLFILLALVFLLNFTQFFITMKKGAERKRPYPIFASGVQDEMLNPSEQISSSVKYGPVSKTNSSIVQYDIDEEKPTTGTGAGADNGTCVNTDYSEEGEALGICPQIPPDLGPLNLSVPMDFISSSVSKGGYYRPNSCAARQQIAVIIPDSKNGTNMMRFLRHIHPFLMKQQTDYQIFVIKHENATTPFSRGQLFNIGVVEAQKMRSGWHCLVFHDPELLPLDTRNLYRCSWYPRQLATTVGVGEHETRYHPAVGGALAITPELFEKLNGFSNTLLGRDEDYVDFHKRLRWANLTLERSDPIVGFYKSYGSAPDMNSTYSVVVSPFHLLDGLTSLLYEVKNTQFYQLFTLVTVHDGITNNGKIKSSNATVMPPTI